MKRPTQQKRILSVLLRDGHGSKSPLRRELSIENIGNNIMLLRHKGYQIDTFMTPNASPGLAPYAEYCPKSPTPLNAPYLYREFFVIPDPDNPGKYLFKEKPNGYPDWCDHPTPIPNGWTALPALPILTAD